MFGTTDADYAIVSGAIAIEPALDWLDYKVKYQYIDADGAIGAGDGKHRSRQLKFDVHEEESFCSCRNPRRHTHFTRTATGIIPVGPGQGWYANNLVEDLQELVDAFPDRVLTGYLEVQPLLTTDPCWRLCVVNGVATKVYPTLVWPESTAVGS